MKTVLIATLGLASLLCAEESSVKDSAAIKQALTKPVYTSKGAKGARVVPREIRRIDLQAIRFKFDFTEIADSES